MPPRLADFGTSGICGQGVTQVIQMLLADIDMAIATGPSAVHRLGALAGQTGFVLESGQDLPTGPRRAMLWSRGTGLLPVALVEAAS